MKNKPPERGAKKWKEVWNV